MGISVETLAVAKKYTNRSIEGISGSLAGKNATIDSITDIAGGHRVTFKWTADNGDVRTQSMDVMNGTKGDKGETGDAGLGIKSVAVNEEDHLIITYDDDTIEDAGQIQVTAAVDSVNGKTGDVDLTASDVGALPDNTSIPSKTSDLTNDSNFVADASYVHTDNNYDATAKGIVDSVTAALAGKVDKETGKSLIDLTTVVDGASYDSTNHLILFKNGTTTLFSLDAAAFVKDGMVDTVEITGGNLVITFNTDAGKQAISIPLTDIFDPSNYYNKTATDNLLADKADDTSVYKTFSFGNTGSGGGTVKYIELTGSYPNNAAKENSYMITGRNGESAILVLPTGMTTGAYNDPRLLYLTRGTSTPIVSANLDSTNGKVYIGIGSYTYLHISQIGGERTNWSGEIITELPSGATTVAIVSDVANKADKVSGATNGDFAGLDVNGNLTDSGKKASDFATPENVQDSINTSADLLKDTVGWIGKNLLKNEASTLTTNGITWTVNDDGTILINGTNTDNSYLVVNSNISLDVDTEYILSGNTTENADEWYLSLFLQVGYEGMTNYQYIFNNNPTGVKFKLRDIIGESNLTSLRCYARVGIRHEAQTVDNVTFYPMIRYATISDSTYEPYHENVETMYEEEIHGVNLFDDNKIEVGKAWNGDVNANRARNIILCEPNSEYIVSMNGTNGLDAVFFSVSASIPPASQTAITSFPYTIRTGVSDRYITLGFNKTDIALSDVTALKIMLRKADIEDNTYRPYNNQAIQNQLNDKGVLGAKNLIGNPEFGRSGSYYTVQDDNSVVFNGTPSANLFFNYGLNKNNRNYSYVIPIEPGKSYIVSGCPEGGNGSGSGMPTNYAIRCYVQFSDESLQWLGSDFGKGVKITVPSDAVYVFVQIVITAGTVLSDVIFRPMIRLASDPDDIYQPFVMTNKQLTERIKTIVNEAITEAFSAHATKWHDNADDCNVGFERTNNYRTSNMPTTGTEQTSVWYNIMTVREGNNPESVNWGYGFQIAVQTTSTSTMGDTYVRSVNGGTTPTWSEWKKLN